jgi:ribosomal protein S18 acetylase RimI-like enzyme
VLTVQEVDPKEWADFREMVEGYWQELMPKAEVVTDPERREAYFHARFAWDGGNNHPHWAIVGTRRVGVLAFEVSDDQTRARVNDFYVVPEERRRGYGTAMVRWLFSYLDRLGVEQIDLNVRRDNPIGLAFWRAQGFGVAGYGLRQYRDPESGTAFEGVLSSDF